MKIVSLLIISLLLISGCAGTGFNKKATLMPDEVWIQDEMDSNQDLRQIKIVGGMKWKLQ